MTTLLSLMGFLALTVAGLGLGLWQLVRLRQHGRPALPQLAQAAPLHTYGPMARLFDRRDMQFLKSQPGCGPGMTTRLRLERRAVLSLYLSQAHADFRQCWAGCLALAPASQSPEFAVTAVKQFVAFYGLYSALRVHCLLGLVVYVRPDVGGLTAILHRLQERAGQAIAQRPARLPAVSAR